MSPKQPLWKTRGREWACDDLMIGFSAPIRNVDIVTKPTLDTLTLYLGRFQCDTSYATDKARRATFEAGDVTFTEAGTELYSRTEWFPEIIHISSPTSYQKRLFGEMTQDISLTDTSTSGMPLPHQQELSRLLLQFIGSNGFGGRLKAEALTCLVLTEMLRARTGTQIVKHVGGLGKAVTKRIRDYVHAHSDSDLSLDRLAELAGVSPFHFARMFKQETGMSPHQFVIHSRVQQARAALLDTTDTIADIAFATGFSSQSHMTESFRKIVGTTPARFRQLVDE